MIVQQSAEREEPHWAVRDLKGELQNLKRHRECRN